MAKICEAVTRVNGALRLDPDRTPNPTGRGAGAGRKTEATAHCYYSYGMAGGKERGTNTCSPAAHWPDGSLIRRAHDPKVVLDWPSTWRLKAVTPGQFQPQRKVEYPRAKFSTAALIRRADREIRRAGSFPKQEASSIGDLNFRIWKEFQL